MDPVALHRRGVELSTRTVAGIGDDQWSASTPCAEWDVRDLVIHLLEEQLWVPPIVAGRKVEDVGEVDADLGDDPKGRHERAAAAAQEAVEEPGALDRTAHLSFADLPMPAYVMQRTADMVIHSWDLAVATGQDLQVDDDLAQAAWDATAPFVTQEVRDAGVFGPEVPVPADADPLTRLLGLTGRDPSLGRR